MYPGSLFFSIMAYGETTPVALPGRAGEDLESVHKSDARPCLPGSLVIPTERIPTEMSG